jgi:hemerythrin superfamily protein
LDNPVESLLNADHKSLDRLLGQVFAAIEARDADLSYRRLDRFWARLAVHIRAEHLHLFPFVLKAFDVRGIPPTGAIEIIRELHADHDFFMRELAKAIKMMRRAASGGGDEIDNVREILASVQRRLVRHNNVEEEQIYKLVDDSSPAESLLADSIQREIHNLPPRFGEKQGDE